MNHVIRTAVLLTLSATVGVAMACDGEAKGSCAMKGAADATAAAEGVLPKGATVATMTVSGMECGSCALKIRQALEGQTGIQLAIVDYDTKTMQVAYDAAKIKPSEIQTIVKDAGFEAAPQGV